MGCRGGTAARAAMALSLAMLAAACLQPIQKTERDEAFLKADAGRAVWRKVAVLPFSGSPEHGRVAAEWLAFRLSRHGLFEIVDPSAAEIELGKKGFRAAGPELTADEARKAGQLLGVDGVVVGSIDPRPRTGLPSRTPISARLVETATGKVVAATTQSRVVWGVSYDGQRPVIAAVDAVAEELVPVLHAAAGKRWIPPPAEPPQ